MRNEVTFLLSTSEKADIILNLFYKQSLDQYLEIPSMKANSNPFPCLLIPKKKKKTAKHRACNPSQQWIQNLKSYSETSSYYSLSPAQPGHFLSLSFPTSERDMEWW